MISRNNSYFDKELCVNGHYIVTGYTNDRFCNDMLQLTDIKAEIHRYLKYDQGFDAVFMMDGLNLLFCYDQESFDILRGNETRHEAPTNDPELNAILMQSPLGILPEDINDGTNTANAGPVNEDVPDGPLHMGGQSAAISWEQVTRQLRSPDHRCALVICNTDAVLRLLGNQNMTILEELQSFHSTEHSIVVYIFRETTIASIIESVESMENASLEWSRLVRNVLIPRMDSGDPEANRVISLRTPNEREIMNLLNHLRLRRNNRLNVSVPEIGEVSKVIAASCARQKWGLVNLVTHIEGCMTEHPDLQLSMDTWRVFTGEEDYVSPMEQLAQLVGMDDVKNAIRLWYAQKLRNAELRSDARLQSSRFTPLPVTNNSLGHSLNMQLKGNPGTGKTTIARLMGQLYYELALLPQGHLVECTAADLISEFVGGTARRVRERVEEAMGGVLFIDEAYSLVTNPHGIEAVNQLVNDMSTYEGQFAVIMAGYPAQMDEVMRTNPGLPSRFPNSYTLPNYTAEQMQEIFELMAENDSESPVISEELNEKLPDFCEAWVGGATKSWGNAREAKKLLSDMKNRCSDRIYRERLDPNRLELRSEDIPENLQYCLNPRSHDVAEALKEINDMTGLKNVKKYMRRLVRNIRIGTEEKAPGNYIFYGPPGTGKTMIAHRMGEILGHLRILRRRTNNVVECKAADLLNDSRNLTELVDDARGGVLFIDEAHQLNQNDYGRSILRALVPLVEDPDIHADTCFILAGYSAEMRRLLNADRGLSERFPENHRIRFDNYNAAELTEILKEKAKERGQVPSKEYLDRSQTALEKYLEHRPANFGNGRFIRETYLPDSIAARNTRLTKAVTGEADGILTEEQSEMIGAENKITLTEEDIPASFRQFAGPAGRRRKESRTARTMFSELYGKEEIVNYGEALLSDSSYEEDFGASASVGMHYSIAGPTGVGKQLSVKAIAAARKEAGLLDGDDVMFVSKADFEGQYVGETNVKTQGVIEEAINGTLAVMYPSTMLSRSRNDLSYGPEALGTIIGAMGSHMNDLSVVFIDTEDGMEAFFKAFPSVRGMLSRQFTVDDLSFENMNRIFDLKTADNMVFESELEELLPDFFMNWVNARGGLNDAVSAWTNGLEVDRLIGDISQNWKNQKGDTRTDTVSEGGSSYQLERRFITMEMIPQPLRKYMKQTTSMSEDALKELGDMTGLSSVKKSVEAVERRLRRSGSNVSPGLYCYIGNPGVGKTTVARIMGGVLRATIPGFYGHVIIRTARQMCDSLDEFDKIIKLARKGILFIDEAHQLAEQGNYLGNSVIKRLLTVLEDESVVKDTCIILAGYPYPMRQLLERDSGLASRFGTENSIIRFDDYTPSELLSIMDDMASKPDRFTQIGVGSPLSLSDGYRRAALQVFRTVIRQHDPNYGNARFVRNFLHDSVDEMYRRFDSEYGRDEAVPEEASNQLLKEDIPEKFKDMIKKQRMKATVKAECLNTEAKDPITGDNFNEMFEELAQSVVLLEKYIHGEKAGEGTGTLVTSSGHILTCAHVVRGAEQLRARIYCPGAVGGDYRWFDCEIADNIEEDCDMAVVMIEGTNFKAMNVRMMNDEISLNEPTMLIGYPLGSMLSGRIIDNLKASHFSGQIASVQEVRGLQRYYVDSTGLHGNSGSPVISERDGRLIGVFSGSVTPHKDGNLDELNFFYPIRYFWDRFVLE